MRIAVIHSFYRSAVSSGENNTVLAQVEALRGAGHEVKLIAQYTDENRKRNPLYPLKAGFDVATGNGYDPTPELEKFQPDVVWVHNLFPNFSTRWLSKWRGPLIATLHNYRPVCANGVLFRDGHVCTLCPDGRPLSSLKYGCYKNSRLATAPMTIQIAKGLGRNPLISRADVVITLSERSFDFFRLIGVKSEVMRVLPNFTPDLGHSRSTARPRDRWVFMGRLSDEKGLAALVTSWPANHHLCIYGDGPMRETLSGMIGDKPHIQLMGRFAARDLSRVLEEALGLIWPSECWETQGLAVAEALSLGRPIVARRGSVGADLVAQTKTGAVYDGSSESLLTALEAVSRAYNSLGNICRQTYQELFSQKTWMNKVDVLLHDLRVNSMKGVALANVT